MATMETENAKRSLSSKTACLAEMKMEIDLVTRSAMDANARVAEGIEVAESAKTDKAQVDELRSRVAALQEWAIASAAAKEVITEENKMLERKLQEYESTLGESDSKSEPSSPSSAGNKTVERHLLEQLYLVRLSSEIIKLWTSKQLSCAGSLILHPMIKISISQYLRER